MIKGVEENGRSADQAFSFMRGSYVNLSFGGCAANL